MGSNLTRRLVRDGWKVHFIIRPNANLEQIKDIEDQVTLNVHDGSIEGMNGIIAEAQPAVVFHLASLFLSEHTPNDIEGLIVSNILFGTQLLNAMVAHGITKIVNTGTSWQHYENKPYSPVNLYAATKQAFEAILQYYAETMPLSVITLKLFDTYGPGDPRAKLFKLLRNVASGGQQPLAMSPGEQLIDLVYIDDVVEAFILAAERLSSVPTGRQEFYAVSSGMPISLKELIRSYERVVGKLLPIELGGRPYRRREVMAPWDRGEALPGWTPKVALEKGIRIMEHIPEGHSN